MLSPSERKQLSALKDKVVSNAADIGDSLPAVGLPISITTDAVRIMGKIRQYNNENACTTETEDLTGCTAASRQDIARQDAMKFP